MARNRRSSTSMSFALGQGCFLMLIGVVIVGISFTKIIIGSEFVSCCPSREMIPVYVIVSGCLPVLLSAIRHPFDGGHSEDKERCSMKISLVTAVVGVMVNLAWLVAGTYLVVTTLSGNLCNTPGPNPIGDGLRTTFPTTPPINRTVQEILPQNWTKLPQDNGQNMTTTGKKNLETSSDKHITEDENEVRQNMTEAVKDVVNKSESENVMLDDSSGTQSENTDHEVKTDENVRDTNNDTIVSKTGDTSTKGTNENEKSQAKAFGKDIITDKESSENNKISDITKTSSQDKHCITCSKLILRFSLAVVVIDWMFVAFGVVYFCHFVYYRCSIIKDQILLINA